MTTTLFTPVVALAIAGFLRYPTDPPAPHPSANPQPGVSSPSESAPVPSDQPPTLHLLTNGRILQGRLTQEGDSYVIRQKIGPVPIRKAEWVGAFRTIEEAYRFLASQLPDNDPDEHLKLAKWCVGQNLSAHAQRHLRAVLDLQPNHPEASRMSANIEAAELRKQQERENETAAAAAESRSDRDRDRNRDPNVMAAAMSRDVSVTQETDRTNARAQALQEARNRYSSRQGAPAIFDLPPSAAIKRTQEFEMYAHRVLQKRCAGCHNERHDGDFQLIQALRRQDWNAEVVLYNMDATLRWIDPKDPLRSQLLISSLLPHKPANKPIFTGQNDQNYKILATWAKSLQSSASASASTSASAGRTRNAGLTPFSASPRIPSESAERFASDRLDPNAAPPIARSSALDAPDDGYGANGNANMDADELGTPPREPSELPAFRSGVFQGTENNVSDPRALEDFQRQIGARPPQRKAPPLDPSSMRPPGSIVPGSHAGLPTVPPGDPELELSPLHGGDLSQLRRPMPGKAQPPSKLPKAASKPSGRPPEAELYPPKSPDREGDPSKPKVKIDSRVLEGLILRNGS